MRTGKKSGRELHAIASELRKDILDISYWAGLPAIGSCRTSPHRYAKHCWRGQVQAGVGHIGPALSIIDILTVLYFKILRIDSTHPLQKTRDRFILSKGHAATALYVVLHKLGFFSTKTLRTFCQDRGLLGVHPHYKPEWGLELLTGSLGHGLGVGVGMALALRARISNKYQYPISTNKKRIGHLSAKGRSAFGGKFPRVFVLISDAELNEGSTWEAIQFAAQHKLDNLTVIVDVNGNQAFGKTRDILDLEPLLPKWQSFGWQGRVVPGHDYGQLERTFSDLPFQKGSPSVVVAQTVSGKGISFMENKVEWHYWSLTKARYRKALKEISLH